MSRLHVEFSRLHVEKDILDDGVVDVDDVEKKRENNDAESEL
jgi:hypothetical protein